MTAVTPAALSLDGALQLAVAHHQAGRLQEAEQFYRTILQAQPEQPEANHNLGVLAGQAGQHAAGLPYLKAALQANPAQERYWLSYGEALWASGQAEEALRILRAALQRGFNTSAAQTLLRKIEAAALNGIAKEKAPHSAEIAELVGLLTAGRYAELESQARLLIERYPNSGFIWKILGASLQAQGKQALPALQKATEFLPDDAEAHSNLGVALYNLGQLDDAVASYRQALRVQPGLAEAQYNLGIALKDLGQIEDAVMAYRRALELKPEYAEAHYNLGIALQDLGQLDAAVVSYGRALQLQPDYADAHSNLGNALQDLGQLDAAVASYHRALQIKPDYAEIHSNLGAALQALGRFDRAVASYRRALEIKPEYAEGHVNLGIALQDLGQFDDAVASYRRALEIEPDYAKAHSNLLFALNYHPDKRSEEIFEAYREYDRRFGAPHREVWRGHGNSRNKTRRLKVGYVSPDFRRHSIRHFLEPLLAHHDKGAVEVYAYAELLRPDEVTARYQEYADHWIPTAGMSDVALAERIRADGIDVLVDLAGHTARNRLQVFARKPAPVSLSWLGYGYTTGLSAIDYLLTDATSAPVGSEGLFSETPWRLTTPCYAYRPAEGMGEVSPLPVLARGYVTFGTLTRAVRINHRTIRVWSGILKRVAGARLVIDSQNFQDATMQNALAEQFAAHGIGPERLEIGCHSPPWDVLRGIDIGLDCFPHNSGATLFETLYMGVPLVTLAGRPSVGCLGSSILKGLGHPEWIAGSEEEYVEIATALATDLSRLTGLRAGLRAEMRASPLMDEAGFVRKVEAAYRAMFEKWTRGDRATARVHDQALPEAKGAHLAELFNAGRYAEMESQARLLIEQSPDSGIAWKALAASLQFQGKAEALLALQKAMVFVPDDAEVHYNLGIVLQGLGQLHDAMVSYRRALQIQPDFTAAHSNLGIVLQALGLLDDAVASHRRALRFRSDYAEAHINLGNALQELGQHDNAAASYRRALQIQPASAEARNNLANSLQALGQFDGAVACYRQALQLKPDYAEAHLNLGVALRDLGQFDEALASYRRALAIQPDYTEAYSNLLFGLNYHPDKSAEETFAAYREYEERFGVPLRASWRGHGNSPDTSRRLKVGYVSPDFRHHSSRHFLEPLLAHHDKAMVEVYAYAAVSREDKVTARYRGYADHWVPTLGLSDEALAERIRADGIDILVDLAGHTAKNRLGVFARKPAPVSLSWLGFGYTTGLTAIDYLLTDAASAPAGSEGLFSEAPWRLATPCYAYRPAEGMGEVSALPAQSRGHITFGTLTRAVRLNHRTIRVWSALLKRVAGARLVIDSQNFRSAAMQDALVEKFAAHGIGRERLEIGCHSPPWNVLRGIDIGLDCFPHNSGTTLFETLYMGIPFVTLAGRPSVGRLGSSILQGLGHPEWIAQTEEAYVEIAAALAADWPGLTALRAGLRRAMQTGPLMDEEGFARKVETAYRMMFGKWASGQSGGVRRTSRAVMQREPDTPITEVPAQQIATAVGGSDNPALLLAEENQLAALFNVGRYAEMESLAGFLTEQYPDVGAGWKALGTSLQLQGKAAVSALQKTTELLPNDEGGHYNLGIALQSLGQLDSAAASYRRALQINPDYAQAHNNLGNVLRDLGHRDSPAASYRRALQIRPDYTEAHYNLGIVLQNLGQFDGAAASYRQAVEINPDYFQAHGNLGNALKDLGQLDSAVSSYRRALAINPDFADGHSNLGNVLSDLGQFDEAVMHYRRALEIKPDHAEAHNNLGNILQDLGRLDEALASYRRALQIKPDYAEAHSNLLFALNYHQERHGAEILAACRAYDERFGLPHRGAWRAHGNSRNAQRRLKVGYVSPDFRRHAVAYFIEPVLANHDRDQIEVYGYYNHPLADEITERIAARVDHWLPCKTLSDEQLAERIRADGIDILVDLAGHTAHNRMGVFARKPAPIQVIYLGYPGSSGLTAMDYRLTDAHADPVGSEAHYSEALVRLPDSLWCYRPGADMPEVVALPALRNGYITFGSFNHFNKIDEQCIALWATLLRALPSARLLLVTVPEGGARERVARQFAALGIEPERLAFQGKLAGGEFLRTLQQVDIALDPIHVNGATTTCESLWLGVPVISLTGSRFLSRAGLSLLSAAGQERFVAGSAEHFVEIARQLAGDIPLLAEIRHGLRARVAASPLADEIRFTRNLERIYREMFVKSNAFAAPGMGAFS